ncbi:serine/threonine-protein kinase [Streptomyces sp. CG 926]|uniref:serine/threonine-protein kinase n=1 Tax=Streptomyces sp. CG 926 TaxID=1882405 RepID=UPI000D6DB94E|nr:serine/threonine-protein kinase [Streptomyces sp. CG 926]PWK65616.1 serine/threonine-protein kinase [Streptomyces sp. CG 926]
MRPVGSKYLLEEPLGRGATGTVWRARQREAAGAEAAVAGQPGETVAIKVLKEELAQDPDIVMRFLRERSVLLRLTHPNIVRTRDLVVEGDLLALVMDLIDGPDLHKYLRQNGPFTPVAASLLTAQIADALAASHTDGVVHRDLKPANVLLDERGGQMKPMLTDFGIARLADSPGLTRTHEFVGTPAYVAPESAEGRPQTSAVDIYGAGILLYELLTGRPPFAGGTALEVLHRHLSEDPQRPSTVPEPLWTVVERCLRKEPNERPSAESLARALRVVASGIGGHSSAAEVEAALGVGALLAPDPSPAPVPETPGAPVGGYDPNGMTSVLPPVGAADATSVLPSTAADPTSVMPPVQRPDSPHPWQSQMQAARDRNEQTQIQRLDPNDDPLRRRPQRQAPPPPQHRPQQQPPQYRQGPPAPQQQYQQPQQPQYRQPQQPPQQQYAPPPPQHYQPQPYQQQPQQQPQYHRPQQQPPQPPPQQRPAPREPREPREPRRSANPVRIPGLGCLKGCLVLILVFFVAGWLVWELTPLQEWVGTGRGWWDQIWTWGSDAVDWVSTIGDSAGSSGSAKP